LTSARKVGAAREILTTELFFVDLTFIPKSMILMGGAPSSGGVGVGSFGDAPFGL
jgi:hypothetical protein